MLASIVSLTFSVPAISSDLSEDRLQQVASEAHAMFKDVTEGANANYIPILDEVPSELFGIAIVTSDGTIVTAGDINYRFSIQSV